MTPSDLARTLVRRAAARRDADQSEGDRCRRELALAHAWYTGLETIFERVARELDESVPTGDRWRRALRGRLLREVMAELVKERGRPA